MGTFRKSACGRICFCVPDCSLNCGGGEQCRKYVFNGGRSYAEILCKYPDNDALIQLVLVDLPARSRYNKE